MKTKIVTRNLVLFAIILICLDLAMGRVMEYFYFRQQSGLMFRTTYAMDSTMAETLIFGSSRANHHYVPEIFEDSLQTTYYNTGRDGNFLFFNYAVFKSILGRYQPKRVIFDINPDEFIYRVRDYDRLSTLLPYYRSHPEIRDLVHLRSPLEQIKLLSGTYPYNSMITTIVVGNMAFNKSRKSDNKGYVALYRQMNDEMPDSVRSSAQPAKIHLDDQKIRILLEIIRDCRERKIDLWFVQSPRYVVSGNDATNEYFAEICRQNHISYFDLSQSPSFLTRPGLFADPGHLNDQGARVFSNMVVGRINSEIAK